MHFFPCFHKDKVQYKDLFWPSYKILHLKKLVVEVGGVGFLILCILKHHLVVKNDNFDRNKSFFLALMQCISGTSAYHGVRLFVHFFQPFGPILKGVYIHNFPEMVFVLVLKQRQFEKNILTYRGRVLYNLLMIIKYIFLRNYF